MSKEAPTPHRNFDDYRTSVASHLERLEYSGTQPKDIEMADARNKGLSPRHFAESWVRRHRS